MVNWNDIFMYDNGEVYYKIKPSPKVREGAKAGYLENTGYVRLTYKKKRYQAHTIIWEMHKGPIPEGMYIDHLNHVRNDNRLENLRIVSKKDNARNLRRSTRNTTGVTNVSYHKRDKSYQVNLMIKGKQRYLGTFKDLELAELVAIEAREKYGYHENHGT